MLKKKQIEQEFFNRLVEVLEEQFPKRKCKERGRALVLNAYANIIFKDILKKVLKDREKYFFDYLRNLGFMFSQLGISVRDMADIKAIKQAIIKYKNDN